MEELILVDNDDCEVGFMEKEDCHAGLGTLHRSFGVFIFNCKGELLIQRRSRDRKLWPGFWSESCRGHPRKGEEVEDAAARQTVEDLGIACGLKFVYKFKYSAAFSSLGTEREFCHVFVGCSDDFVVVDEDDISETKWVCPADLFLDVSLNPDNYAPWFLEEILELKRLGEI